MKTIQVWLLSFWFCGVCGATPSVPDFDDIVGEPTVRSEAGASIGRIEASFGEVELIDGNQRRVEITEHLLLMRGDIIHVTIGARLRVKLASGDLLDVGEDSLIGFYLQDDSAITLWKGLMAATVFPTIGGYRETLSGQTLHGSFKTIAGKFVIDTGYDGFGTVAVVLDNRLVWQENNEPERVVVTGRLLHSNGDGYPDIKSVSANKRLRMAARASSEVLLVREALELYSEEKTEQSKQQFATLQLAFPHSPLASYYLGQIALENNQLDEAVKQWQHYAKLDPIAAKEKGINRHLTLLISKNMQQQIKEALAQEGKISKKPEPGTIAVTPLKSAGDDVRYQAIARGLTAMLVSDLSKVPSLKVLERKKINALMNELKLMKSGLVDKSTAARSGRLLGAETVVTGGLSLTTEP